MPDKMNSKYPVNCAGECMEYAIIVVQNSMIDFYEGTLFRPYRSSLKLIMTNDGVWLPKKTDLNR